MSALTNARAARSRGRDAESRPPVKRTAHESAKAPVIILADYAGQKEANAALARAREALRQIEQQSVRIDALGAEIDRWIGGDTR